MKKKNGGENLERFYDYGIDVDNRVLYMGSESYSYDDGETGVDHFMAERAIKGLLTLDCQYPDGDKPIKIILNSPGGDVYHGMAIYDAMRSCRNKITVIVYGYGMSMGSILLQAADKRVVAPNARIMIHYGYTSHGYNHPKINDNWNEEYKKGNKEMEQLYLKRIQEKHPKYKLEDVQKLLQFDTILTAKEAVDLGLADEVLKVN